MPPIHIHRPIYLINFPISQMGKYIATIKPELPAMGSSKDIRFTVHLITIYSLCRAMHKRGLCRRAVSVWLAVMFVYCVETAKDTATVAIKCE